MNLFALFIISGAVVLSNSHAHDSMVVSAPSSSSVPQKSRLVPTLDFSKVKKDQEETTGTCGTHRLMPGQKFFEDAFKELNSRGASGEHLEEVTKMVERIRLRRKRALGVFTER